MITTHAEYRDHIHIRCGVLPICKFSDVEQRFSDYQIANILDYYRANEVCEGYVFTGVCLSQDGGVSAPLYAGIHTPLGPEADTPPR